MLFVICNSILKRGLKKTEYGDHGICEGKAVAKNSCLCIYVYTFIKLNTFERLKIHLQIKTVGTQLTVHFSLCYAKKQ